MSSKLERLLASYEAERNSLITELAECVAEMDYARAQLFSEALARLNRQLQTLYTIKDKWHDEKLQQVHGIERLEKKLASAKDCMRSYYTEQLAARQEKLAELMRASPPKAAAKQVVRIFLDRLLAKEITGFTLVFQESKRLYCGIRLVRNTLLLTIPEIHRHRSSHTLAKSHIRNFQRLGFRLYDNKDKLMLIAPYSTSEEVSAVQRILARITFEVFSFKELAGKTFIKYHQ